MTNHHGFRQYRSGEAVTVPTGKPYQLACSDCATVHSLVHTLTDDGEIQMQVFVDPDETARLRALEDAERCARAPVLSSPMQE